MDSVATQSILNMISHIIFIIITWKSLQSLQLDGIFKKGRIFEARILVILVTIMIGTTVSNFFLDLLQWSQNLKYLL
ncbi:membrane protein [Pontibacillus halophilus JSM 076056 = DSM 19796]|uniref:Membrane protein n=1 Tax=Pontibacillus halophilus JSM 076056 = DSM 19796 TaxID=1385510 RepID=A0A0A5GKU5_9BACI|nr:DUF1146 family protein [Pontibacillus halophilus]KGX93896.1 membrane protein [Pontibacillus halophilus JSM 076056 = DSM 19796]